MEDQILGHYQRRAFRLKESLQDLLEEERVVGYLRRFAVNARRDYDFRSWENQWCIKLFDWEVYRSGKRRQKPVFFPEALQTCRTSAEEKCMLFQPAPATGILDG